VPQDHPLRVIRLPVNAALNRLPVTFNQLHSAIGRASIPPGQLRRLLLPALFHGPLGAATDGAADLQHDVPLVRRSVGTRRCGTFFTKNRGRLVAGDVARAFPSCRRSWPNRRAGLSDGQVSVDGMLIEAWASMKSFQPKDGSGEPPAEGRNGETRRNETHASTYRPGRTSLQEGQGPGGEAVPHGRYRSGLVVAASVPLATGTAERDAAAAMIGDLPAGERITLGADKAYDAADFVVEMRRLGVTPRLAQNGTRRRSAIDCRAAIDGRTAHHACHKASQRIRKRIAEVLGWAKTVGGQRKTRYRGTARGGSMFTLADAAYNLVGCRSCWVPQRSDTQSWVRIRPGAAIFAGQDAVSLVTSQQQETPESGGFRGFFHCP